MIKGCGRAAGLRPRRAHAVTAGDAPLSVTARMLRTKSLDDATRPPADNDSSRNVQRRRPPSGLGGTRPGPSEIKDHFGWQTGAGGGNVGAASRYGVEYVAKRPSAAVLALKFDRCRNWPAGRRVLRQRSPVAAKARTTTASTRRTTINCSCGATPIVGGASARGSPATHTPLTVTQAGSRSPDARPGRSHSAASRRAFAAFAYTGSATSTTAQARASPRAGVTDFRSPTTRRSPDSGSTQTP